MASIPLQASSLIFMDTDSMLGVLIFNFEETEKIIFKYIEIYYNQRRKDSANGWKASTHCEKEWYNLKNVA